MNIHHSAFNHAQHRSVCNLQLPTDFTPRILLGAIVSHRTNIHSIHWSTVSDNRFQTQSTIPKPRECRDPSTTIIMSSSQQASTTSKNDSEKATVGSEEKAHASALPEKPSSAGNVAGAGAGTAVSGFTAWGSTSGKPYLASPRLNEPKSSSVITSYFNSMMGGKQPTNEPRQD